MIKKRTVTAPFPDINHIYIKAVSGMEERLNSLEPLSVHLNNFLHSSYRPHIKLNHVRPLPTDISARGKGEPEGDAMPIE